MIEPENILTISALNQLIKKDLEYNFSNIVVEGEISNFVAHSSGHKYFSLKDSATQISAVMWKGQRLDFKPDDGQKVIAFGSISVYPPRGSYQIQVNKMIPQGVGNLFIEFEKLKEKLKNQGYFNPDIKKLIPQIPKKIGVSTSPTGAAIRDVISTITRRFSAVEILIRPTIVQGSDSSSDIAKAIKELDSQNCDVLIIGRGGGSIEDLWAYNTELVAEAIYNAKTPIISAVGHETDFTIADFVADVRAATPTAAAEIATPILLSDINNFLIQSENKFKSIVNKEFETISNKLKLLSTNKVLILLKNKVNLIQQQLDYNEDNLNNKIHNKFKDLMNKLINYELNLKASDPNIPLKRGYARIERGNKIISKNDKLLKNDRIKIIRYNQENEAIIIDENQK